MILLYSTAAAILLAMLRGGDLRKLGGVRIHWAWLVPASLIIQLILIYQVPHSSGPARVLFPLTHFAILAVAWRNREQRGMKVFAVGVALNLLAMVANGGFMPVAPEALAHAGFAESAESVLVHARQPVSKGLVLMKHETALWWLSDIIALRVPIQTIVSIGDVLIAVGVLFFVQEKMLGED